MRKYKLILHQTILNAINSKYAIVFPVETKKHIMY